MASGFAVPAAPKDRPGEVSEIAERSRSAITRVNVNLPSLLVQAVDAIAKRFGLTRTDVIVRALNREAYFARLEAEDPKAKFFVERSNGDTQEIVFVAH